MQDTSKFSHYEASELIDWVTTTFERVGVPFDCAKQTANVLIRTNLRGVDTHGVARVPAYLEKILEQEVNAKPSPQMQWSNEVLLFDGDNGLGQYVASQAVLHALERARHVPVVTCLIRRSGHMGALGQFILPAAEEGMIALMFQDTPPLMALPGSSGAAIGNNPIAFAAPVAGKAPLLFDMATSVVARGNLLQAVRDKLTEIPPDWAIGPDGRPTTDPAIALKGAMAPMSGHKGIGLAMIAQVLAGSLTGSEKIPGATSSGGNASAFVQIFNPDLLIGRESFDRHMNQWLAQFLNASGEGGRYPGERAAKCEHERRASGIPLPPSVVQELADLERLTGQSFSLSTVET